MPLASARSWLFSAAVLCLQSISWADPRAAASSAAAVTREADPLETCIEAHRMARSALERQTLIQARSELQTCASPGCPIAIRAECREWLNEAERQVPTLVFSAVSEFGDVDRAKVFVDGKLAAESLDGHPLEAQPGPHVIAFELPDGRRRELHVVIGIGEKDRIVRADFSPPRVPTPTAGPAAPLTTSLPGQPLVAPTATLPTHDESRLGMILGLAALGGAIASGGLMYVGVHARNAARDRCAPFCSESEVNRVRRWFILADVVGVAAVVTGGASLYVYISNANGSKQPNAMLGWRGEF